MKKQKISLLLVFLLVVSMIAGCSKADLVEQLVDEATEVVEEQIGEEVEAVQEVVNENVEAVIEASETEVKVETNDSDNLEPLRNALSNTFPKENFSMVLKNQLGEELIIHAGGYDGEQCLDTPIILSKVMDMNDKELMLRSYNEGGYYYTIADDKKIVEKYQSSVFELKLFDFERTSYRGTRNNDETLRYIFENMGRGSVSGLKEFYEYEIDINTNQFSKIYIYKKESIKDEETFGEILEYTIESFGEADESLFDIPDDYTIIDHGENSHNDGEHMPAWFE